MKHVIFFLLILASCTTVVQQTELPSARPTETLTISDGETVTLEAIPVTKPINGSITTMYGYNRQIPGPLLKVKRDSRATVRFKNSLPEPTTIHWHGIRAVYTSDGVPEITQQEVKPGETYEYKLTFPDEGVYWYHAHMREDKQQELG